MVRPARQNVRACLGDMAFHGGGAYLISALDDGSAICDFQHDVSVFGCYANERAALPISIHLAGRGFFRDDKGEHIVEKGQGFLCLIDDATTSYYYGEQNGDPWIFIAVCIEGEAARVMVRDLVKTHGPLFHVAVGAPIWQQLQSLKTGQYSSPHVAPMTAVELASMMLVVLSQSVASEGEDSGDILMKRAMHRLFLPTPLPEVAELANSLHVSREHFSRVFRRHMAVSPQTWINQERINRACHLLSATDFSNKQIAFQLGFGETSSFLRAFRRAMHLSPQQFRQNAQEMSLPKRRSEKVSSHL